MIGKKKEAHVRRPSGKVNKSKPLALPKSAKAIESASKAREGALKALPILCSHYTVIVQFVKS